MRGRRAKADRPSHSPRFGINNPAHGFVLQGQKGRRPTLLGPRAADLTAVVSKHGLVIFNLLSPLEDFQATGYLIQT